VPENESKSAHFLGILLQNLKLRKATGFLNEINIFRQF